MPRIAAGVVLVAWFGVATLAVEDKPTDYAALGRDVVRIVGDDFLDLHRASEWAARHAGYADNVRDADEFPERNDLGLPLDQVLQQLELSG